MYFLTVCLLTLPVFQSSALGLQQFIDYDRLLKSLIIKLIEQLMETASSTLHVIDKSSTVTVESLMRHFVESTMLPDRLFPTSNTQ